MFSRDKKLGSTPLSEFIRNASSSDKKRVYKEVIERSSREQQALLERARLQRKASLQAV